MTLMCSSILKDKRAGLASRLLNRNCVRGTFLLLIAWRLLDSSTGLHAATNTWTGGLGVPSGFPFWATPSNWFGLTLPAVSNDLVFPVSAFQKATINNLGVPVYRSLTFGGGGY